jgi:uncharacterized membrane protein
MSSRSRLWPTLIVASTLATGVLVFGGFDAPLRSIVVLAFLLVCPGLALVRLLRIREPVTEVTLGVALSVALAVVVPGTMLYAGAWSPQLGLALLIAATLAASVHELLRPRSA